MSSRTLGLSDDLYDYLLSVTPREDPLLAELRRKTVTLPGAGMQISPEQGRFMRLLVELTGARRALEVGTFTGYSALCVALALPGDGELVCCDIDAEYPSIGREFWQRAGVANKIDLRIAPARDTLDALLAEGRGESFDFAFIDADKTGYDAYYERALRLLRPGGLVAIDNVLWGGSVIDQDDRSDDTRAIRALNAKLAEDQRVSLSLLPVGDGLTLARKR